MGSGRMEGSHRPYKLQKDLQSHFLLKVLDQDYPVSNGQEKASMDQSAIRILRTYTSREFLSQIDSQNLLPGLSLPPEACQV
ncbi:hypothetical protein N7454_010759 [Penicillium verhagenii]|nr:hypothetical protein N7454_010759 [Penicillium verhagenii]